MASGWLRERGIEAYVIHAASVAVSREHRRAKTDRLDTELLKRASLAQYAHSCKNGHTTRRWHSDAQLFNRTETFRFLMVGVVLTPSVGMAWTLIAWRQLSVKSAIYGKLAGPFVSGLLAHSSADRWIFG
jgi:hypothetical protein